MYSDDWIEKGYEKNNPLKLSHEVDLCIWNCEDNTIGVSVNFEISNDVHYDIYYNEWLKFEGWVKNINNKTLEEYFEGMDWLSFETQLEQLEIKYNKAAYYD